MKSTSVFDCSVIELRKIYKREGNISVIENNIDLPFEVRRVYYLYDIPGGAERGGHAHKKLKQLIIAASGCFDVILNDGKNKKIIELNRPNYGLLMEPGIWRELINFSSGAICLVLASHIYENEDYIRDLNEFKYYKGI